jgi:hypothetical protein
MELVARSAGVKIQWMGDDVAPFRAKGRGMYRWSPLENASLAFSLAAENQLDVMFSEGRVIGYSEDGVRIERTFPAGELESAMVAITDVIAALEEARST